MGLLIIPMGVFKDFICGALLKTASLPLLRSDRYSVGSSFFSSFSSAKDSKDLYKGWVYACVNSIITEVAQIDFKLYRMDAKGNKELATNHPALRMINNVNSFFTKYTSFKEFEI